MEFNLKVNQEMLNGIIEGINELPTKKGMPLLQEISKQVEAFNQTLKEKESEEKVVEE